MRVDLTITGTVESLHLEPGDRVIVTVEDRHLTPEHISRLRDQLTAKFADNEVVILNGLRIAKQAA